MPLILFSRYYCKHLNLPLLKTTRNGLYAINMSALWLTVSFWVFALMLCTRGFVVVLNFLFFYQRNLNPLTRNNNNFFFGSWMFGPYTQILISGSYLTLVKWLIWFNQDFLSLTITKVLNYDQKWKGGQRFYRYH